MERIDGIPDDGAEVEQNKWGHGMTSFGTKSGVSASRFDQTDNKGKVESASQKTSQVSKEAK